ncbi:MAG: hypothetical protein ACP5EQ_01185 [Candidatus Cloacimonadia bacterium]
MMIKRFFILLFFVFLFTSFLYSVSPEANIEYLSKPYKFPIFNIDAEKIINYYSLKPDEELRARAIGVDSLYIYTRLIIKDTAQLSYRYSLQIDSEPPIFVEKSARRSSVSRGIAGEEISTYNKFTSEMDSVSQIIKIKNLSAQGIIVRLHGNNISKSAKKIPYVSFTPQKYAKERIILIDDREYTYYSPTNEKIELTLDGPILLKIISRLVFPNSIEERYGYRYKLYDNEKLLCTVTEKAYKSTRSSLLDGRGKAISTGDVNIIKLSEGIHHIMVEDCDKNRDLIFKFYINKNSIDTELE